MSVARSLPVIMPSIPNQRWSCHSCGNCCRSLVGHLFESDRRRIDQQGWEHQLGVAPYVRMGREWVLNKTADEACVFLDANGLCKIHAKYGEAAKPFACRIFPFSVRPVERGWQVSFRFDCPSSTSSLGKPIAQHASWLRELVAGLQHRPRSDEDVADLQPRVRATEAEIDLIFNRFHRWLTASEPPFAQRLIGAARITNTLCAAQFTNVRGGRLGELLDLLFTALPAECSQPPQAPTRRQSGLLRQIAFAHVEHVSHAEATSGRWTKFRKRWQQLRRARRFLKGKGRVPRLRGLGPWALPSSNRAVNSPLADPPVDPAFEAVEAVTCGREDDSIAELVLRYLIARLESRACFGEGYYGWPIFSGLAALWLGVPAAGWLGRYRAACAGRTSVSFEDVACAVGVVDRAATRLPALGAPAERIRVAYLARNDGLARLMARYLPISDDSRSVSLVP